MLIETLSKTAKIPEEKLISLSQSANVRYKVYHIPKRSGGTRKIEHPSKHIKAIQRWLVQALIIRFPVHDAATAYRKGSGIKVNAEFHRKTKFTNRYDFADFFPSFEQKLVVQFIAAQSHKVGINLSDRDLEFIGNIVCRHGRLTIGAPSSPAITNAMMYEFDMHLHEACKSQNIVYTRYADDVFVSSFEPRKLDHIEGTILASLDDIQYLSLRLNNKKTVALSKKYKRQVTGVVITPQHKLSIGRSRKRLIKHLIHQWMIGKIDSERLSFLKGMFAFAIDIEPSFETQLEQKYGSKVIRDLRKMRDHLAR